VRGVCLDKTIDLNFRREGYAVSYVGGVEPGTRNIDLVMQGSGRLHGRVRASAGVELRELCIALKRTSPEKFEPGCGGVGGVGEQGDFDWPDLTPGTYLLEVKANGTIGAPTLLKREGVVVDAGVDVDLGKLEIAATGHKITLRLVAEDGTEVPAGYFSALIAPHSSLQKKREEMDPFQGKDLWKTLFRDRLERGTFSTVTTERIEQFEAAIPGYRFVHLENIAEDRTLELKRGLRVRLKLKQKVGPPLDGCTFHVGLVSRGEGPRKPYFTSLYRSEAFSADGTAILLAPDPGKYWIQWIVERASAGGSTANANVDDRQQLTILDQDTEQVFELDPLVDPSKIDPGKK
jgi:hypothetical protein